MSLIDAHVSVVCGLRGVCVLWTGHAGACASLAELWDRLEALDHAVKHPPIVVSFDVSALPEKAAK